MRSIGYSVGAERVNSVSLVHSYCIHSKASVTTREMAERIPFWPNTIRMIDLVRTTGLSKQSIASRISSCHSEYLIFSDRKGLSRLREDLTNCN